jgi:hypothetical protein
LNLTSVDPGEIVVFQDKEGKLKSSNVSLDDILVRKIGVADNVIALFQDGKLKPGALYSFFTDTIASVKDEFTKFIELQRSIVDKIDKPLLEFLGNPPVTNPSLSSIRASILELVTLQSKYDDHVKTFTNLEKISLINFLDLRLIKSK